VVSENKFCPDQKSASTVAPAWRHGFDISCLCMPSASGLGIRHVSQTCVAKNNKKTFKRNTMKHPFNWFQCLLDSFWIVLKYVATINSKPAFSGWHGPQRPDFNRPTLLETNRKTRRAACMCTAHAGEWTSVACAPEGLFESEPVPVQAPTAQ